VLKSQPSLFLQHYHIDGQFSTAKALMPLAV
jgi:hypothetical protein